MISKCLCIALFAILQISAVLCRTTGTPEGHLKENEFVPTSESVMIGKERLRVYAPESFHEGTDIPGNMKYDDDYNYRKIHDEFIHTYNKVLDVYAIVGIVVGVFAIVSLILGVILMIVCRKQPRRGYVVNSSTGGTQQPGITGSNIPMQQYPSQYGQKQ